MALTFNSLDDDNVLQIYLNLPWKGAEIKIHRCRESLPYRMRIGRQRGRREATCDAVSCPLWAHHPIDEVKVD